MLLALSAGRTAGLVAAGAAFVAFALLASMVVPRWRPDFPGRSLGLFIVVAALFTAGMLTTVVVVAKESEEKEAAPRQGETAPPTQAPPSPTQAPTTGAEPKGDARAGERVFKTAGCASCHTLAAAGAKGTVGPNLDQARPDLALIVDRVTNGKGVMPSFKGQLSEKDIRDVAAYVFQATHG
ncbi:MAG: hypothetical protein C4299_01330 [Thermoleophilia bacterium]